MSTHRPPPILISGSLGLDFLNTLATPVDTQIDWIDDGDGLLAWLEQARLVSAKDLKALKARAMPGEFDAVAAQARSLREWFRGFVKVRSGRSICPDDLRELEPLNRLLVRDEQFTRLVAHTHGRGVRPGVEDSTTLATPRSPCCCRSARNSRDSCAAEISST